MPLTQAESEAVNRLYQPGNEIVHLLYPDANGPITGSEGRKFAVACDPKSPMPKVATGESVAVNCPLCQKSEPFKKVRDSQTLSTNPADRAAQEAIAAAAKQEVAANSADPDAD